VPSSKDPGTAPSKTAGRSLLAASHSQSAPVTRGTKDEKDHHCDVMDSRTALSSRLFFSWRCPPINQPFPNVLWLRPLNIKLQYSSRRCMSSFHVGERRLFRDSFVLDGLDDALAGGGTGREKAGEDTYNEA
jgi:hypothetical protein